MFDGVLHCFCFVFTVFMVSLQAINVSVQYNGGLLPDIFSVEPMLQPLGNLIKCHEEVLYLQPLIPPKRFDIFSPLTRGCSEGLGAF